MNALTRDIARRLREGADVLTVAKQPLPGMTGAQTRAFVGRIADEVFNLGIDKEGSEPPTTPPLTPEQKADRLAAYMEGLTDGAAGKLCGIGASGFREWRISLGLASHHRPGRARKTA
jgi:hypothetical protein